MTDDRLASDGGPNLVDLVVEGCDHVVWGEAPYEVLRSRSIVIDGGRIVGLVEEGAAAPRARRVVDGRRAVAVPGFVNAHTHTAFSQERGGEPELPLDEWLPHVFASAAHIGPPEAHHAAVHGYGEMARAGITTALDHHYAQAHPRNAVEVARAAAASGVRAAIATTMSDLGDGAVELGEGLERLDELVEACAAPGWERVSPWVALASPGRRESPERCRALVEWCRTRGMRLTYHYAETTAWFDLVAQFGLPRLVDLLVELDLLGPDVVIAHGVWFGEQDFEVLAESGTWISYNPVANGYMGDGITPVGAMRAAGVNVCMGTDTVQCCGRADPFEMMKVGALLQKAAHADARALVARDVLHLATAAGAQALGVPSAGVLAPGRAADVVLVDLDRPHLQPVHDVVWTLVYAACALDVRTTIVGGEVLPTDLLPGRRDP